MPEQKSTRSSPISTTSSLTWLDYSDRQRRDALDVIDSFSEPSTVDELGVGTVRDALADHFFPGTSTIQTRIGYFLFVPWLMNNLERKRAASADVARISRKDQDRLCRGLLKSADEEGVIGRYAGELVQRLPSSVYWAGLGSWGLRLFPGSEDQYHRSLDGFHRRRAAQITGEDGEPILTDLGSNWHSQLPPPPSGFPDQVSFGLRHEDAEYLADRIVARHRTSLLGEFVQRRVVPGDHEFPWQESIVPNLPALLQDALRHAENFSLGMHGAALLYNLILAEKRAHTTWADEYRDRLNLWWAELSASGTAFADWDVRQLWQRLAQLAARISPRTQQFVDGWLRLARSAQGVAALADSRDARQLVAGRERQLKGARARVDNPSALEQWRGASGIQRLDFRWGRPTRRMIMELVTPLLSEAADA